MRAQPKDQGLPTTAYYAKTEVREVSGLLLLHIAVVRFTAVASVMQGLRPFCATRCVQDGTQKSQKVFVNVPTEVGATEAEEIGGLPVVARSGIILVCAAQQSSPLKHCAAPSAPSSCNALQA